MCEEARVGQVCWVVDALDECTDREERKNLLRQTTQLLQKSNRAKDNCVYFRMLLTSRPEIWQELSSSVTQQPQDLSGLSRMTLENESSIEKDIKTFIRHEIDMLVNEGLVQRRVALKLEDKLREGADRTFIWPQLLLQAIRNDPESYSESRLEAALQIIPQSLEGIYEKLLFQLADNTSSPGGPTRLPSRTKKLFQFVLAAQGLLTVSELNILFSLESDPGTIVAAEREADDIGPVVERVYGSFLRPVTDANGVQQVRLFHDTARTHLLVPVSKSQYALELSDCHLVLAEGCISYLWLHDFADVFQQLTLESLESAPQKRQFIRYASLQWAYHVRESEDLMNDELLEKVLSLYSTRSRRYANWTAAYWSFSSGHMGGRAPTPLQMCAYNGHARVLRRLLQNIGTSDIQAEIDQCDAAGNTALHYAAEKGRAASIAVLMEFKADPTIRNTAGLAPLHKAVNANEEPATFALLNAGVNVDTRTTGENPNRTILHLAAESGLQRMVEKLVEHGANIDILDSGFRTAAKIAFDKGHGEIARFLDTNQLDSGITDLDRAIIDGNEVRVRELVRAGASLSSKDNRGLTPLHRAARGGNASILKFLLGDTNNTEAIDDDGRTPLHVAARYGQFATMDVLISRNAKLNVKSTDGLTPLHEGVFSGKQSIIDRLLDAGGNQLESDREKRTPLFSASSLGYDKIVKVLLENSGEEKAELMEDDNGRLPIHIAAENGHTAAVIALLNRNNNTISREDRKGCSPLSLAACGTSQSHAETVKYLIQRGANICHRQRDGSTPLLLAAMSGNEQSVKYLLGEGYDIPRSQKVNLDERNSRRSSPVSLAIAKGHESVALLLLKYGARDVSQNVHPGRRNPLSWAAGHGMFEVVKLLLAIPDIPIDSTDATSRTPLSWAAEKGHTDVIKLLLEPPGKTTSTANIDSVDTHNRTPLSWAAGAGHDPVVKILLSQGADPTLKSKLFGSPITWAAREGHKKVFLTLLESNLIQEKDMLDHNGGSLMHLAASNGKLEIIKLLLDHPDPALNDPNKLNKTGENSILIASSYGHDDIVRILLNHGARVDIKMPYSGHTALTFAIQFGYWVTVDMLIKHDKNVLRTKTAEDYTPLFVAVCEGHYEIVKLLLDNGCDPDMHPTRKRHHTLLHAAADAGHFLVLKLVLKYIGHRFTSQDAEGRTPLMLAVMNGHELAVITLLNYAQSMELEVQEILCPDHRQRSILTAAVESKNLGIVRSILDLVSKEPNILNAKDTDGWTPLSRAAAIGSTDILRLLFNPDNVNEKDFVWHQQPLLWASRYRNEEAVQLFLNDSALNQKLDRYPTSENGCTSLWCAVRYSQLSMVKLLLQDDSPQPHLRKAWLNATDRYPDNMLSPLQMAVANNSPEIVKLLLEERDVEVNAQNQHGVSVFLSAVLTGNKSLVKTLAEVPAIDINLRDHENHSALMLACRDGYLSIVKYLLDCNKMTTPIDVTDNEGMSALAHACVAADPAIVQLLLDCGASITQKVPPSNRNLLMLAARGGSVQIVATLSDRDELNINATDDAGYTAMAIAAMANKSNVIRLLLSKKADPNTRSRRSQRTPLMEAAYAGCAAAVRELLLSPNIDFTCTDNSGRTVTWFLMRQTSLLNSQEPRPAGRGSTAELFLEFEQEKLCVNEVDIGGTTPLVLLASRGDNLSLRRLLNLGADIKYQSWETGQSVFHEAAKSYHPQMLSELLDASKLDKAFDCRDLDHATPLSYAAGNTKDLALQGPDWDMNSLDPENIWDSYFENYHNQVSQRYQMVQMLLEHGAEVNSATRKAGTTPIMFAARLGWENIVSLLLDSGATVDTRDTNYCTALSAAVQIGHYATVKRLLEAGASHDIKDRTGANVVILAAENGHLQVLRLFIHKYHLSINHRDRDGRTALSYAAERRHAEIVRYLLEQEQQSRADLVDALDRQDQSALIWACKGGDCTIIQLLIQNKANASRKDRNGRMPLSHAAEYGQANACRLLLEEESGDKLLDTLNWKDDAGRTALSWAAEENRIAVIRALLMRGADPLLCDKRKQTPRMFALARGHTKVARMLEAENTSPQSAS